MIVVSVFGVNTGDGRTPVGQDPAPAARNKFSRDPDVFSARNRGCIVSPAVMAVSVKAGVAGEAIFSDLRLRALQVHGQRGLRQAGSGRRDTSTCSCGCGREICSALAAEVSKSPQGEFPCWLCELARCLLYVLCFLRRHIHARWASPPAIPPSVNGCCSTQGTRLRSIKPES